MIFSKPSLCPFFHLFPFPFWQVCPYVSVRNKAWMVLVFSFALSRPRKEGHDSSVTNKRKRSSFVRAHSESLLPSLKLRRFFGNHAVRLWYEGTYGATRQSCLSDPCKGCFESGKIVLCLRKPKVATRRQIVPLNHTFF